jgi:FkbM family methyltransferase
MKDTESLRDTLREHPAVADAAIARGPDGTVAARVVPDPEAAPLLHRSAVIEATGRIGGLGWHEPADSIRVAGINRSETDFLYREIFAENAYLRHGITVPPGAVVVDVGANIGMFTLRAALERPDARIIAVEPVAELADAVALNAELYGMNAAVVRSAAGSTKGRTDFTFYRHNSVMSGAFADITEDAAVLTGYLLTGDGAERSAQLDRLVADRMSAVHTSVPVTTLARIAADFGLTRIDLLKIDVEKAEAEVLKGIGETLWPLIGQVVMEVHDVGGRLDSVMRELRARGFDVARDSDPRLARTPCHNVYARRPALPVTSPAARGGEPALGPTLRVLERELRELVARRRPSGAVPDRFLVVPDLAAEGAEPSRPDAAPVPVPASRTAVLAAIWADLFGAAAVRPDADFFDLGGDSLTAVRLLARLEASLGEDALAPDAIFTDGTFGALAALVEASAAARPETGS